MKSRRSFPVYLLLLAVACTFFAFRSVPNKYEKIIKNVMLVLREAHYNPKPLNDQFSQEVFTKYLEQLDVNKDVLLKSDIDMLRKKYGNSIDEELSGKNKPEFFNEAGELYKKRFEELAAVYKEMLAKPFDFDKDEVVVLDPKKINNPGSEAERKEYWRKRMKYMALERLNDLVNQQEAAKDKPGYVEKSMADMEKEAREKSLKVMNRMFEGMRKKSTMDEYFRIFMNAVTENMDPHTSYLPPVEKRNFDEEMSGRYGGIGAGLMEEDGNVKIRSLTSGSPAWKSGELAVGDVLLSVAQDGAEPVDVSGLTTSDCVKLIRGKVGTEVRLTVKKADGNTKTIKLVRQELTLEDTFVKSTVIKQGDEKIGLIYLPEFYADFERPGGSRCSQDVAREIEKFKKEGVTGIIMDLRNNGGGSLWDVVQMAGFFIEDGPIVQVRDREGVVTPQPDRDKRVLWTGPLAVMVNEFSASASEIFAAAIQDYNRGIVIGSTSTFGKGTVQRQIPLNFDNNRMLDTDEYGSIKITLQKFYRVNGGSTQLKGVTPDVVIPDTYEYLKYREKDDAAAMKWDEVNKAGYKAWTTNPADLEQVRNTSIARVNNDTTFQRIKANTQWLDQQFDKEYPLSLAKYREEQKRIKATTKQMEGLLKSRTELDVSFMKEDEAKFLGGEKEKTDRNTSFLKGQRTDIYVAEAVKVMQDMIKANNLAMNAKKP